MTDKEPPEEEDEEELPGRRRYCTLSLKTINRLNKLKNAGIYGRSVPFLMTRFIEDGLRAAHREGYLTDEDMS